MTVWQKDGMSDEKLEPPTLPDYSNEVKTSYRIPARTKEELTRISHQRGVSEAVVVAEFLQWAINAWRKGFKP